MLKPRSLMAIVVLLHGNITFAANAEANATTKQLLNAGESRLADNQKAQKVIDGQAEQEQTLTKQYIEELKLYKNLTMYNEMLDRQLNDQQTEINKINHSIANATLIERQVLPLLDRMVQGLSQFIALDLPFLTEERNNRVENLRQLLSDSKLTTSEKARRVFEAYQIENEFGYTIESYKGNIQLGGAKFAAELLRIGRISLMYRDLSGNRFGFWNNKTQQWQPLEESQYKRHISKGLKIAKEEVAPDLITIPLVVDLESR